MQCRSQRVSSPGSRLRAVRPERDAGEPSRAGKQVPLLGPRGSGQLRLEEAADHAPGEAGLELTGTRGQSRHARSASLVTYDGEKRRLADPRRPLEHQGATLACAGSLNAPTDLGQVRS